MKLLFILFCLMLGMTSCFDIFTNDSYYVKIVGDIFVQNPQSQEDSGYFLMISEDEVTLKLTTGYVEDLFGNDSILIIKEIKRDECNASYLFVKHDRGKKLFSSTPISLEDFTNYRKSVSKKYAFSDNTYVCR